MGSLTASKIINDKLSVEVVNKENLNTMRMAYPVTEPKWLDIPTYDGTGQAVHPSVCIPQSASGLFGGHKYWMAMTPYADSDNSLENPSILCSDDGINWEVPTGVTNPLVAPLTSPNYNADPNLVFNPFDNYMYLYWNAQGKDIGGAGYSAIARMIKSKDGKNWTDPVDIKAVLPNGTEYPVAFSGSGIECLSDGSWIALNNRKEGGNAYSIGQGNLSLFTSSDGLTWTELPNTYDNLTGSHWHISFRRFASGFHFISSVANNESGSAYNLNLFYGYSPDGKAPLFDSVPLFGIDKVNLPTKKWYASCIVPLGQKTSRVYFSGQDMNGEWHIGYFDVVLNNPYKFYVESPQYKMGYSSLWHQYDLRDTSEHVSFPINTTKTAYYGIKKLCEFKECALICINTLKDDSNVSVPVELTAITRYDSGNFTEKIDGVEQKVNIPSESVTNVITKETLKVLGIRSIDRVGFRIKANTAPVKGHLSIYLVPQE